jgi:hypothetical protein
MADHSCTSHIITPFVVHGASFFEVVNTSANRAAAGVPLHVQPV